MMISAEGELSKVDTAYSRIKDLVIQYDLVRDIELSVSPGEHLHIEVIGDRVKASATPVRQALERLHGEGLIDCIPKRGFFAKIPDASELQELYEFALLILNWSIKRAGDQSPLKRCVTSQFGPRMTGHTSLLETCTDHQASIIESVYAGIVSLSRNAQMNRTIRNFNDRSRYVRRLALAQSPAPIELVKEIVELVEFVRDGQTAMACLRLEAVISLQMKRLPQLLCSARPRWSKVSTMGSD
jgi:DNA-binding GntR family transcriptional regulator